MSLKNWEKSGWLKPHLTSRQEIADLFAVADRDLSAAQTPGLVTDWRLNIAYNAALQLATAALAAAGYQAVRVAHHYRVVQSLAFTLKLDPGDIAQFDDFRKLRNQSDSEQAGLVSDAEADEMFQLATRLRSEVEIWIKTHHSTLL